MGSIIRNTALLPGSILVWMSLARIGDDTGPVWEDGDATGLANPIAARWFPPPGLGMTSPRDHPSLERTGRDLNEPRIRAMLLKGVWTASAAAGLTPSGGLNWNITGHPVRNGERGIELAIAAPLTRRAPKQHGGLWSSRTGGFLGLLASSACADAQGVPLGRRHLGNMLRGGVRWSDPEATAPRPCAPPTSG